MTHTTKYSTKKVNGSTIQYIEASFTTAPQQLTKLQFIRHLQSYGGLTIEQTVASVNDERLAYFWLIFEMTGGFNYDDDSLKPALDSLVVLGYLPLPNAKQSILDNWPKV